ncbi:MAG: flippase-like domain-containing protein [Clostridia bacterium]|nr:flippase-like domain-containing protein [Clostridia bacterium]
MTEINKELTSESVDMVENTECGLDDVQAEVQADCQAETQVEVQTESQESGEKKKKVLAEHELTHEHIVGNVEERLELPSEETINKKPKTKKEKTKKILTTTLFILFNVIAVGVVLFIEIKDSNFLGFQDVMRRIGEHYEWLLVLIGAFIAHLLADTFVFFAMINKCGYGHRYSLSAKVAILGSYYDNITPYSTGGQPFQMHYMAKANIDAPTAITLPVVKHAIRVFAMDGLAIAFFIFAKTEVSGVVLAGTIIWIIVTPMLPLILMIFSKNIGFTLKMTRKLVHLGKKMRLVKDEEKAIAKAQDNVDSFIAAFKFLGKRKSIILIVGVLSLVDLFAVATYPYIIVRMLGGDGSFGELISKAFYTTFSSGLIPTPGSSGAAEASFYNVFSNVAPEGTLFWAVILYRVFTFYLPILCGVVLQIVDAILGKHKGKAKLVKKEITWLSQKTINNKNR